MNNIFDVNAVSVQETVEQEKLPAHHDIFIPERFQDAVQSHADMFSARLHYKTIRAAQILIITGQPGNGKTRMAEAALQKIGIQPLTVSASVLGGEFEGQSVKPLVAAYLEAEGENGQCGAIILDDYDLSAGGIDEKLTGTVNSSLLNSFMMNVADNPFQIRVSHPNKTTEHPVESPPILIVTANDTRKIYEPLKRPGRAFVFEWEPTNAELEGIVSGLYPALPAASVKRLVKTFPGQSIAFFETLGYAAVRAFVRAYRKNAKETTHSAASIRYLAHAVEGIAAGSKITELMRAGKAVLAADTSRSYLTDHENDNRSV